jgi:uncharacterized protein YPO0396
MEDWTAIGGIPMTEVGKNTQPAMCYPKSPQYEQWKKWADEMGYKSVSQFMIAMIETGYKQMNIAIGYDEDTKELREQRNELKRELDRERDRLQRLEERLYHDERRAIVNFLDERPEGASFAEIVQHIIDDAPTRVARVLDEMDGDEIRLVDGRYEAGGIEDNEQ